MGVLSSLLAAVDGLIERLPRKRWRDAPLAALLLTPALCVLGVFGFAPIFYAIYLSAFQHRGVLKGEFIGASNYLEALTNSEFWHSALITFYYALGTIPLSLILSFIAASALFRIVRGRGFFRTIYFLPYVTSAVAAATVWRVILNPKSGLINTALAWCGISETPFSQWLLEPRSIFHIVSAGLVPENVGPSLALCCVIMFEVWHSCGFMIVVMLAGLTTMPRELEESAVIDGAGWLRTTWHVTLPLLSPTIFFLVVVSSIKAFQAFNSFYALTLDGRGPVNTTQNMTVYIFANFYEYGRTGYGAAVAALLSLGIVALTVIQWRYVGRRVHYG